MQCSAELGCIKLSVCGMQIESDTSDADFMHFVQLGVTDIEVDSDNSSSFAVLPLQGINQRPIVCSIDRDCYNAGMIETNTCFVRL